MSFGNEEIGIAEPSFEDLTDLFTFTVKKISWPSSEVVSSIVLLKKRNRNAAVWETNPSS